jgi:hypothetical protein
VKSIVFNSNLTPLETPSKSLDVSVESTLSRENLRLRYTLLSPALAAKGLEAFAWEASASQFSETLWKKTCFEVFVADRASERYWEWNFSPTGAWGAFSFSAARVRAPAEARRDAGFPVLTNDLSRLWEGRLVLEVTLDWSFSPWLAWGAANDRLSRDAVFSLNAITDSASGERVHWALRHGESGRADFHLRANFLSLKEIISR